MMTRRTFITDTAKHTALTLAGASLFNNTLFASNEFPSVRDVDLPGRPSRYQNVITTVRLKGKDVKVHGLCTGTVAVKANFRSKRGIDEFAKLNIILDKHYTEYLPIWVWVIEHPDGLIVVDTGETAAIRQMNKYLSEESAFMRYFFRHASIFSIDEADELNHQFQKANLRIDDVKLVVLTHLHLDHTDGLKFFPKQEIIVGSHEFKTASGNMPSTYPAWFKPNKVEYKKERVDIFEQAYPLTASEDLLYIPTPGHSHGHSSVLFKTDDFDLLFAGDTSYNQEQVIKGELAGISADYKASKKTYDQLIAYATCHKIIYLPSHDANAGQRLINKTLLV